MSQSIIIRGQKDAGKTTSCAAIYKEMIKNAELTRLFTMSWQPIEEIQYTSYGEPHDFIAIIIFDGIVIIIISAGDEPDVLKDLLIKIQDKTFLKTTADIKQDIDFIICCARSRNVNGSTIKMLYNKIDEDKRKEFWVPKKAIDLKQAEEAKKELVSDVINYIKNYKN